MIWAYLAHLSFNMWEEAEAKIPAGTDQRMRWILNLRRARPELRVDDAVWTEMTERLRSAGANMIVIDLGEGKTFEWMIRRSELPDDLKQVREHDIQKAIDELRRQRRLTEGQP